MHQLQALELANDRRRRVDLLLKHTHEFHIETGTFAGRVDQLKDYYRLTSFDLGGSHTSLYDSFDDLLKALEPLLRTG